MGVLQCDGRAGRTMQEMPDVRARGAVRDSAGGVPGQLPPGDRAIVQRCQVHKARNVRDHLPEARRAYVARQMRDAYDSTTAATAQKKPMQLASWLDSNGEDGAAASLREGLDETLTVMRLKFPRRRGAPSQPPRRSRT